MRVIPLRAVLAVAYMGMLLGLSLLPAREVARLGLSAQLVNLLHVPLFAGLAWVTLSAVEAPARIRVAVVAGFCLGFALMNEWIQSFAPGRVPAFDDVLADGLGIALGIGAREGLRPIMLSWKGDPRE